VAVLPVDHPLAKGRCRLKRWQMSASSYATETSRRHFSTRSLRSAPKAAFSPRIIQTSNVLSSVLTLVQAGEGVTLIPSSLQHMRFNDLAFCRLTTHTSAVELVMAWSPARESTMQQAFLEYVRGKKEWIQKTVANRIS